MSKRGEQLLALRKLHLTDIQIHEKETEITVSAVALKSTLRAIDDHDGSRHCYARVDTLAKETCQSERTVRRAIRGLVKMGFVNEKPRLGSTSILSINWDRIPIPTSEIVSDVKYLPTSETSASTSETSASTSETSASTSEVVSDKTEEPDETVEPDVCATKVAEQDSELIEWIAFWNRLHSMKLVVSSTSREPNEGVLKAWKRVKKSKDLQMLLSDRKKVELAIQKSEFVRGGWFTLPKLLSGKNRDGEFVVQKLLDEGYVSSSKRSIANAGDGVNFNPERDMSNARF